MSDLIGAQLGPYRISEQIGRGGMATVYKAYHAAMSRDVAVKILPLQMSDDVNFRKRFQLEVRVIASLEHAHILPVYDYGEKDRRLYLVMRYIDKGTLKERMATGPLDLSETKRILQQVGGALAYAHRRDVIHRDIKPGNVLLDAQGDCYLADFGLAKMLDASQSMQLTATGVGMGTPAYMSPEQCQGEKADARSDIYSLGIMLYEMVAGRVPFEADTPMAVVFKHISDPLPPPSSIKADVPPAVEQVIVKSLAKNPAERYATAGEMVSAFQRALSKAKPDTLIPDKKAPPPPPPEDEESVPDTLYVPPTARPPQVPETAASPASPPKSKSPPWWAFAVGAVLLLMIGVAIWGAASGSFFSVGRTPTALSVEERVNEIITATAQAIAKAETEIAAAAETETALTALTAAANLEAEYTATAQGKTTVTAATVSTAAAQAENQAAAEALTVAAAEIEATSNALATVATGVAAADARAEADSEATTLAQTNATATAQTARQTTPTFTPAPPTATPTPTPAASPTTKPAPTTARASISGKLAFPLVQGAHFKVYVVEMQPTAPTDLYAGIGNARHPALSPDGQYLLVDSTGGEFGAITRYTSQGHQATEVTCRAITSESGRPTWSPDSEYLAFDGLNADPANPQVYIHKINAPECNLTDKRFMVQGGVTIENSGLYPLWGLDDRIYFRGCATWIGEGGNCGVWSARSDGGDARKLHDNASYFPTAVGSSQLLTMSAEEGNWEVYSINLNSGQIANLSNSPTSADAWGALSPDGRTIAFLSNRGGPWAIWLMNADGSNPRAWMNIPFDWGEVDPDRIAQDRMSWSK